MTVFFSHSVICFTKHAILHKSAISAAPSLEHLSIIMPDTSILLAWPKNLDHSTGSPRLPHFSLLLLYSDSSSEEQKPGSNPLSFICVPSTTLLSRAQSYENRTDRHALAQCMAGGFLSDLIPLTDRIFSAGDEFYLWI